MAGNLDIVTGMLIGASPVVLLTFVAAYRLVRRRRIWGPVLVLLFAVISGGYAMGSSFDIILNQNGSRRELLTMATYLSSTAVPLALGSFLGILAGLISLGLQKLSIARAPTGDNSAQT